MLKGIIISAQNSGLSGYLKASDIDKIFFVTQTFIGMLSKSVRFYDKMVKISLKFIFQQMKTKTFASPKAKLKCFTHNDQIIVLNIQAKFISSF